MNFQQHNDFADKRPPATRIPLFGDEVEAELKLEFLLRT